jgi:hypothetical protein
MDWGGRSLEIAIGMPLRGAHWEEVTFVSLSGMRYYGDNGKLSSLRARTPGLSKKYLPGHDHT